MKNEKKNQGRPRQCLMNKKNTHTHTTTAAALTIWFNSILQIMWTNKQQKKATQNKTKNQQRTEYNLIERHHTQKSQCWWWSIKLWLPPSFPYTFYLLAYAHRHINATHMNKLHRKFNAIPKRNKNFVCSFQFTKKKKKTNIKSIV